MTRRGWCPTLYKPMSSGDGLLVRLRPPRARLSAAAVQALAEAAKRWGNGVIDLTARGNLQIRGLRPDGAAAFAAAMVEAGLAHPDPLREAVRVVSMPPLCDEGLDHLARAIEAALLPLADDLPPKFGLCLEDEGDAFPIAAMPADLRVWRRGESAMVALDGGDRAGLCSLAELPERIAGLASLLAREDGDASRMRHLTVHAGADALLRQAGFTAQAPAPPPLRPWGPGFDAAAGVLSVRPLFGQTDAAALLALSALAAQSGDGYLRISPFRCLVLAGVTQKEIAAQAAAYGAVSADDRRAALLACPGAPACASATVPSRAAALDLFAALNMTELHVSGCDKGCAGHGRVTVTLVGRNGHYDLVRNGGPQDTPVARGLSLRQVLAHLRKADS